MGEKTGWTYINIPQAIAQQLKPGCKQSFRVKGKLNDLAIQQQAIIPMGGGDFILSLKADLRRQLNIKQGDALLVSLAEDASEFVLCPELMECLGDAPAGLAFFKTLTGSHQKYFSNWINSAKAESTRAKRIAMAVNALERKMGYPEMIRWHKENN